MPQALAPQERTTVLASTQNKLGLEEVTNALKQQWQDWTLKARDNRRRTWTDKFKIHYNMYGDEEE